jgi:hypothetical protein
LGTFPLTFGVTTDNLFLRLTGNIHKSYVGETVSMNTSRRKAGMDEATMVGLREPVHSGLPPIGNPFYE